jgi:hypothetical protein
MPEDSAHPDGQLQHPEVNYEKSDVSFRAILAVMVGALVFAAFVHYVILLFFFDVRKNEAEDKEFAHPLAPRPRPLGDQRANYSESGYPLPREPVLEEVERRAGVEKNDAYKRQESREKILNSYGPTNEKDFVHIPIDRAIALMETDGFRPKVRAAPATGEEKKRYEEQRRRSGGLVDYGESNSGRMFRRGGQQR